MKNGKVGEERYFRPPGIVLENGENNNSSRESTRMMCHVKALGDDTEIPTDEQISRKHRLQCKIHKSQHRWTSIPSGGSHRRDAEDDVKHVVRDMYTGADINERKSQVL